MDVKVIVTPMSTLVDTCITNLFISKEATKNVKLKVEKRMSRLNTVNFKQVSVDVVEKRMEMQLGPSSNKVYIEVIMLDDYEFVLRLEFLNHTNEMLVSFAYVI